MAAPRPNLGLPFNVVRASHVEFGASDLARASAFSSECLGLVGAVQDTDAHLSARHRGAQPSWTVLGQNARSRNLRARLLGLAPARGCASRCSQGGPWWRGKGRLCVSGRGHWTAATVVLGV